MKGKITAWGGVGGGVEVAMVTGSSKIQMSGKKFELGFIYRV